MAQVEELRAEANALFREKKSHHEKAKYAKQPQIISYYNQKARECDQQANQLLAQSDLIHLGINSKEPVIDMHLLTPQRAKDLLARKIDFIRGYNYIVDLSFMIFSDNYPHIKKLQVITGYGKTIGKPSVVKSSVISYLTRNGIPNYVDPKNIGVIIVVLTGINVRLSS